MDNKRRTNAFFLSDGEASRERKRTEDFVKSLVKAPYHLCAACGVRGGNDQWHCKHCNTYFCHKCGENFAEYLNEVSPVCPACGTELHSVREFQAVPDEKKILRYVTSAHIREIKNKQHLFEKLSHLFNKDLIYVESIWSNLEQKNPELINQITSKFKDEALKQVHQRIQYESLHPAETKQDEIITEPIKSNEEDEKRNIKNLEPADGFQSEWKQGKMKPADQKNYRTYQDT